MSNLDQKKFIRGPCDLIWEVGNFDCLACRYHWKVRFPGKLKIIFENFLAKISSHKN